MEKYLSEVEMKLQLVAEDISLALEEQSVAGLQRIPRAVAEIDRVEHESKNLQTRLAGILKRLDEAETGSRASVNRLRDIDAVKGRMELTRDTLGEAAGLSELMRSADDVFAAGNVRSMADIVASMRRSLKVVGSVPEFEDAPERVEDLERRLEQTVRPELVKALTAENAMRATELRNVLDVSGRIVALIHTYADVRVVEPLSREWDAFNTRQGTAGASQSEAQRFAEWLPLYCEKVNSRLKLEVSFCQSAFPREREELVATAWVKLSDKTRKEFSERMASQSLDLFIAAHRAAGDGFAAVARSVAEASGPERAAYALRAALAPFDAVRDRYGELEAKTLASDLATLEVKQVDDVEGASAEMLAAVPVAAEYLGRAMERCVALTAGTQASAMLKAVDDRLVQYIDSLTTAVKRLRRSQGLPGGAAGGRGGEGSTEVRVAGEESIQSALQLTAVAHALTVRVKDLERGLIASLRELRGALLPALPEPGPASEMPQPAAAEALTPALAAVHANPDRARRLRALLDRAEEDAQFQPLAHGVPRCAAFEDVARDFVLDVLLCKVRVEFRGVARRPEWSASAESSEFDLPTFSAYPQGYVTTAGEYLLSLPQHLESIADAAEEERAAAAAVGEMERVGLQEDGEPAKSPTAADAEAAHAVEHFDSGEWMARVAETATGLLLTEVRGITRLGEPGAAQLAADLEYFNNIISALFSEPPSALRTYAVCAAAARDSYAISVRDAEGMDEDVIRAVAKARGIKLDK